MKNFKEFMGLEEAEKTIKEFIKYIPGEYDMMTVKQFTGPKSDEFHINFSYSYEVDDRTDGDTSETSNTTFIIAKDGTMSVEKNNVDFHTHKYVTNTTKIGKLNMNSASGMIDLSKKLKKQYLIGEFEEWYMKTHRANLPKGKMNF